MDHVVADPSKLTSFAPPSGETSSSSGFLSRILNRATRGVDKTPVPPTSSLKTVSYDSSTESVQPLPVSEGQSSFYQSATHSSTHSLSTPPKVRELRSFPNVLTRIVTIIEKKSNGEGLKSYNTSDFRQSWMPDSSCKECYDCGSKFTTLRRRHHCRICGQIFCSRCCNQEVPGGIIGFSEGLRACTYCCGVVSSFMQMEGSDDLGTLKDNLAAKLSDMTTPGGSTPHTPLLSKNSITDDSYEPSNDANISSVFDRAPLSEPMEEMSREERQTLVEDSVQLKLLYYEMNEPDGGVSMSTHRQRLRTYQDCCYGHEIVTWLMDGDKASDRSQANAIGQALMDAKFIYGLSGTVFKDGYSLYKFKQALPSELVATFDGRRKSISHQLAEDEPNWLQELDHTMLTDDGLSMDFTSTLGTSGNQNSFAFGFKDQTKYLLSEGQSDSDTASNSTLHTRLSSCDPVRIRHSSNDQMINHQEEMNHDEGITSPLTVVNTPADDDVDSIIPDRFEQVYSDHISELCTQLLSRYNLSLCWCEVLLNLAKNISRLVRPDVRYGRDNMDIGAYVHIKKVRCGSIADSDTIYGVVSTKRLVHNKMKSEIYSPQIMLLQSSIEYQRVNNKLSSLEPQILQEQEYLQNCVSRISRYKPDILLVENTVSRVAQELLLQAGISVAVNVKPNVMQRVSRMAMADIVPSIDSLISRPQLGTCYKFETDTFRFSDGHYKTLMMFHGCPGNLGCTVLLRGESYDELSLIKPILMMLVYSHYNARLEQGLLMNLSATVPEHYTRKPNRASSRMHLSIASNDSRDPSPVPQTAVTNGTVNGDSLNTGDVEKPLQKQATFRQVLDENILDCSPFIKVDPPYFETSKGSLCRLRKQFPDRPYWSALMLDEQDRGIIPHRITRNEGYDNRLSQERLQSSAAVLIGPHAFTSWGADCPANAKSFKHMATKFRASGARLKLTNPFSSFTFEDYEDSKSTNSNDKIDCFDLAGHQRIQVLFSSISIQPESGPYMCVSPWILNMQFYGDKDVTLGTFLELYCFREAYKCLKADCVVPMVNHIRRFVHDNACLYLILKKIDIPSGFKPEEEAPERSIITWSWCRKCKKTTPPVPLSLNSWHFSFAKYIQLRLKCQLAGSRASDECTHSLVRDYYQYYRCKDTVATFRYANVTMREVRFPPYVITLAHNLSEVDINNQVKRIHTLGMGLYSDVMESLLNLEISGSDREGKKQILSQHTDELEAEKSWFLEKIDDIQTRLMERNKDVSEKTNPDLSVVDMLHMMEEEVILLKQKIAKALQEWNTKLAQFAAREDKLREGDKRLQKVLGESTNMKHKSTENGHNGSATASPATMRRDEPIKSTELDHNKLVHNTPPSDLFLSKPDPEGPISSTTHWSDSSYNSMRTDSEASGQYRGNSNSSMDSSATTPCDPNESVAAVSMINSVTPGMRAGIRSERSASMKSSVSLGSFVVCSPPGFSPTMTAEMNLPDHFVTSEDKNETSAIPSNITTEGESTITNLSSNPSMKDEEELAFTQEVRGLQDGIQNDEGTGPDNQFEEKVEEEKMSQDEKVASGNMRDDFRSVGQTVRIRRESVTDDDLNTVDLRCANLSNPNRSSVADLEALDTVDARSFKRSQSQVSLGGKAKPPLKKSGSRYIIDSIKTAISSTNEGPMVIENPFSENEHYLLTPTLNIPVVIYDEEMSSIIAYTLGSQQYEDELIEYQKQQIMAKHALKDESTATQAGPTPDQIEAVLKLTTVSSITAALRTPSPKPAGTEAGQMTSPNNINSFFTDYHDDVTDGKTVKSTSNSESDQFTVNPHIELQFTEKSESGEKMALFYCKVFFAADFKKLRRRTLVGDEQQFIRSLSRCYKWNAKGGKSGLGFCKTKDNRFIIKQMKKQEMQSFMEFGPHYFDYFDTRLSQTKDKHVPVLAKILGVYRLGFRNSLTGTSNKQDVLVIENLFYNRKMSKIFDLKGSARNRLTKKENASDAVLLDENLMYYIKHNPIYMRSHVRSVFLHSLSQDTQFLAGHTVMDYSLLCGIDEDTKELVVGIIDYIRTFTWDKKLETVVKSPWGQGKMPTIVSPEVYRTRFMEAMERYFYEVPNRWTGLASDQC